MDLVSGKLNGQQAFMSGKLKIKGNMGLHVNAYCCCGTFFLDWTAAFCPLFFTAILITA